MLFKEQSFFLKFVFKIVDRKQLEKAFGLLFVLVEYEYIIYPLMINLKVIIFLNIIVKFSH